MKLISSSGISFHSSNGICVFRFIFGCLPEYKRKDTDSIGIKVFITAIDKWGSTQALSFV